MHIHSIFTRVFLVLALAGGLAFSAQAADSPWVPTWTTAISPPGGFGGPMEFENVTLRQIVHTSAGGSALRVQVSNVFGEKELVLGGASVALQSEGSAIKAGSSHALTFSGHDGITVPPGATVLSDPVEMEVPAFTNLSVSLYLPKGTGPANVHGTAIQTNYVSQPGNHLGAESLPVAHEISSSAFLSGVEVMAGRGARTIVAFGDSITDGMGSTINANHRWPDLLAQRVAKTFGGKVAVVNQGISGNRVLHDVAGQNGIARFERDALSWPNVTHVIVLLGINDIGFASMPAGRLGPGVDTSPVRADEIIAGHRQFIAKAHAKGVKIIGATLTPYQGAGTANAEGEAIREKVNQWIRESGEYDGVIDFDAAARDPQNPGKLKPEFQSGDWIHPSDAGYEAMVRAIDMALLK